MDDRHDSSLLPFGPQSDGSELSPAMQPHALRIYRQAWTAYRENGCPYGPTDRAMLVWYTLRPSSDIHRPITGKN